VAVKFGGHNRLQKAMLLDLKTVWNAETGVFRTFKSNEASGLSYRMAEEDDNGSRDGRGLLATQYSSWLKDSEGTEIVSNVDQ
jgi:hypothetical protein